MENQSIKNQTPDVNHIDWFIESKKKKEVDWSVYRLDKVNKIRNFKNESSYLIDVEDVWHENEKIKIKTSDKNIFSFKENDKEFKSVAKYFNVNLSEFVYLVKNFKEHVLKLLKENEIKVKIKNEGGDLIPSIKKGIFECNINKILNEIKERKTLTVFSAKIVGYDDDVFRCKIMNVIDCYMSFYETSIEEIDNPDSYIGKEIPVIVYNVANDVIYVSHRKYNEYEQKINIDKIKELVINKQKISCVITGINDLGVFIKKDSLIGLIYYNKLKKETKEKIKNGLLKKGDSLEIFVDDVTPDGRCICTDMDYNDFLEKAKEDLLNKVYKGKVINVKNNFAILQIISDDKTSYLTSVNAANTNIKKGDVFDVKVYNVFLDKENKIKTHAKIVK
jgi:hypothetical protein